MVNSRITAGNGVLSPMEVYIREINEVPLLNAEKEKELAMRVARGDAEAREHLVRANLRLVVHIARSFIGKGLGLQDLIQEGNFGLLRAVEIFDPTRNTRFSTYATYWIKQTIKCAIANTSKTIRVPAYMVELLRKWRCATATLRDKLGRSPTKEEVTLHLGVPVEKLKLVGSGLAVYNGKMLQGNSMDDGSSWSETLVDERMRMPDVDMGETEDFTKVTAFLEKMDPRESTIIRMRFGLDGEEPKTLKEVGEKLDLTRERVRQIEKEAIKKLQKRWQG